MATRTDRNVSSHRRLVYRTIIESLRDAFDGFYTREHQFTDLKITQQYPLKKVDFPAIVIEYQNTLVANAGVGHVEWFADQNGELRRWHHNRFEGSLYFTIYALSTLDRDILADALVEVVRFGTLDTQLNRFFEGIYPSGEKWLAFQQIQLDSDQLHSSGDSASIAPWQPEDMLVYTAAYSVAIQGGYYNVVEQQNWSKITHIILDAYGEDSYGVKEEPNHDHLDIAWEPPLDMDDHGIVTGEAVITGEESFEPN